MGFFVSTGEDNATVEEASQRERIIRQEVWPLSISELRVQLLCRQQGRQLHSRWQVSQRLSVSVPHDQLVGIPSFPLSLSFFQATGSRRSSVRSFSWSASSWTPCHPHPRVPPIKATGHQEYTKEEVRLGITANGQNNSSETKIDSLQETQNSTSSNYCLSDRLQLVWLCIDPALVKCKCACLCFCVSVPLWILCDKGTRANLPCQRKKPTGIKRVQMFWDGSLWARKSTCL